ncbi:MAG TPA: MlaD family protein [Gemmatimonadota bacterium]|nr:MlaD family protein [Gemmatimonadota bacterium]
MKQSTFVTWAELRVGILVVAALAILVLAVMTLGGRLGVFTEKYPLYTYMPSVSGLQPGAPVRLAGVDVGTVDEVQFISATERDSIEERFSQAYGDSLGARALLIRFTVEEDVQEKVTRASRAKIGTVGLLGDKYLDLEVGDPREAPLQSGDIVLNEAPIDYEGLIARAAEGVEELVGSLEGTRVLVARINNGEGTLGKMINDPALYNSWVTLTERGSNLLTSMESGDGTLPALINDQELYEQLVRTTGDLQQLTAQIRTGEGTLGKLVRDPELYGEMVQTMREGQQLLAEMEGGDGTIARLVNDPALYERLDRFVVESQALLADIQQNPRKYINLQIF